MLILTRKPGQVITIVPDKNLNPFTPIAELFTKVPIQIAVIQAQGGQVKLGVYADPRMLILRGELYVAERDGIRAVMPR